MHAQPLPEGQELASSRACSRRRPSTQAVPPTCVILPPSVKEQAQIPKAQSPSQAGCGGQSRPSGSGTREAAVGSSGCPVGAFRIRRLEGCAGGCLGLAVPRQDKLHGWRQDFGDGALHTYRGLH